MIKYSFFFNFSFLGYAYLGCIWIFIAVFLFSLVWFACSRRKSVVQSAIYDVESEIGVDSDEEGSFKPSWDGGSRTVNSRGGGYGSRA